MLSTIRLYWACYIYTRDFLKMKLMPFSKNVTWGKAPPATLICICTAHSIFICRLSPQVMGGQLPSKAHVNFRHFMAVFDVACKLPCAVLNMNFHDDLQCHSDVIRYFFMKKYILLTWEFACHIFSLQCSHYVTHIEVKIFWTLHHNLWSCTARHLPNNFSTKPHSTGGV